VHVGVCVGSLQQFLQHDIVTSRRLPSSVVLVDYVILNVVNPWQQDVSRVRRHLFPSIIIVLHLLTSLDTRQQ